MNAWTIILNNLNFGKKDFSSGYFLKEGDVLELEIKPVQTFSGYFRVAQ